MSGSRALAAVACGFAAWITTVSAVAGVVSRLASRVETGEGDSIEWSQFSEFQSPVLMGVTSLGNPFTLAAGPHPHTIYSASTYSSDFTASDVVVAARGQLSASPENLPIRITFLSPVSAAGAQIQVNAFGAPFTATLTAFDLGENPMGTVELTGLRVSDPPLANGSAPFIGIGSNAQDIVSVEFSATVSGVAINRLSIANAVPDADGDGVPDWSDNCPTVSNAGQADGGGGLEIPPDGVGDACDNCIRTNNPRVWPGLAVSAAAYVAANPWATLSGDQRDDDHDGYGNKCDADFTPTGVTVGPDDLVQYRSASGKARSSQTACGSPAGQRCARFDMNEAGVTIGPDDLTVYRGLSGKAKGPRCVTHCTGLATGPLACLSGSATTCSTP